MSLARRSITSAAWRSVANWVSWIVLFVRGVFLARWLPVNVFGIYALASSVVSLVMIVAEFGMAGAFVHRAPETEDEDETAAVHFTLNLIFGVVLVIILALGAFIFTSGPLRTALLLLTATTGVSQLTQTPKLILARRVVHRRLALIKIVDATLTTLVVLGLAWHGATLWALLSSSISSTVLMIFALYVWKPIWQPRLAWSPRVMRYFLRFGSRNFLASFLYRAMDRVDDIWVAAYLGKTPLGFYSKAYSFATYPRKMLALPINSVTGGTYAELKTDRRRLSQAFFRVNALLVRSGFFMAGLLALIAPEFISFAIGAKWLPMLDAFRLMLIFTLLDPMKTMMGHLFVAVGKPGQLARIRLAELTVLIASLYLLGPLLGIVGVALAMDVMVVFGIGLLLWHTREYVDFSIRKLFFVPFLALILGISLARGALLIPGVLDSSWCIGSVKIVFFIVGYTLPFLFLERRQVHKLTASLRNLLPLPACLSRVSSSTTSDLQVRSDTGSAQE